MLEISREIEISTRTFSLKPVSNRFCFLLWIRCDSYVNTSFLVLGHVCVEISGYAEISACFKFHIICDMVIFEDGFIIIGLFNGLVYWMKGSMDELEIWSWVDPRPFGESKHNRHSKRPFCVWEWIWNYWGPCGHSVIDVKVWVPLKIDFFMSFLYLQNPPPDTK